MENQKPHAIMIPASFQGHITPLAHLAVHLASNGFAVTFVLTHHTHQRAAEARPNSGDMFAGARNLLGLDVRCVAVSDGFPLGFDRAHNLDQFVEGLLHVFPAHVDELVGNMVRSGADPPLTCLIADTFHGWASSIAKKHDLVHVSFWTQPALVFDIYYHIHLLKCNGHFDSTAQPSISASTVRLRPRLPRCLLRPALRRIVSDASLSLYDHLHLNFPSSIPRPLLEDLASGTLGSAANFTSSILDGLGLIWWWRAMLGGDEADLVVELGAAGVEGGDDVEVDGGFAEGVANPGGDDEMVLLDRGDAGGLGRRRGDSSWWPLMEAGTGRAEG